MKFRFCGDLDCPDWVLLEISILSVMESSKVDVITGQILSACLQSIFNEEDILRIAEANSEDKVSSLKGVIAAIHFMIRYISSVLFYLYSLKHHELPSPIRLDRCSSRCSLIKVYR
jgi:hypothetical protein